MLLRTIDCKKHGRSVHDVTRTFLKRFLKLKVGGAGRYHLGCASLPDNRKWAKNKKLIGWGWLLKPSATVVTAAAIHLSLVATPLIMQNFKA